MSYFAYEGKHVASNAVTLTNASPSQTLFTPAADEWTDAYTISITSDETVTRSLTISDGTTTLTYAVGGNATGQNPPIIDAASVPVRFGKGATITANATAITAGKHVFVALRSLTSKT